jgi:hypothetical protein
MRETKTLELDGISRKITVRELTVAEMIDALQSVDLSTLTVADLRILFFTKLLPLATDLTEAEFLGCTPSRLQRLWVKVQEVNSAFFGFASLVGLDVAVETLRRQFIGNFLRLLASWSKPGIAESGSTDSPTS